MDGVFYEQYFFGRTKIVLDSSKTLRKNTRRTRMIRVVPGASLFY